MGLGVQIIPSIHLVFVLLKIIQKVTVHQETKIKKKKKTSQITAKRKEYNKLKKALLAVFRKSKKASYTEENKKIKTIPMKERKDVRQKPKTQLEEKLSNLKKQLPSSAKLKIAEIEKLISKAKILKW